MTTSNQYFELFQTQTLRKSRDIGNFKSLATRGHGRGRGGVDMDVDVNVDVDVEAWTWTWTFSWSDFNKTLFFVYFSYCYTYVLQLGKVSLLYENDPPPPVF